MDTTDAPMGTGAKTLVCPNCGAEQAVSGIDARCERCGTLVDPAGSGKGGIVAVPTSAPADPDAVPPAMASGGIGGTNDGTQVVRHAPTAMPGKPMAPIAEEAAAHAADGAHRVDAPSISFAWFGGGAA